MYCDHFGLRAAPFDNTPDPHFFYPTHDHEEALATLMYGVSRFKGFLMLSGEVGTGKTLVSRVMLNKFGDSIAFANISNTYVSPLELLQAVCDEFGIAYPQDAGNLQLSKLLEQFLLDQFARNTPVVLVVDEAQNLPHEAFEQLRMIGNLESDDAKLLQIVMVGQCELRSRFQKPELRQLRQRIFRSYHLPALGRKECEGYIEHRLKVAGHPDGKLFPTDALDSIAAFSKGLPRTINSICDNTLLAAYSDNSPITQALVRKVIEQMMTLELETQQQAAPTPVAATTNAPQTPQTVATDTVVPTSPLKSSDWIEISTEVLPNEVAGTAPLATPAIAAQAPAETPAPRAESTTTDRKVQSPAGGMNTREQRILDRLAAISRDIQRERKHSTERRAATLTKTPSVAAFLGTPANEPLTGHAVTAAGRTAKVRKELDVAGLAALRKSVAECRLALGQLANLDAPTAMKAQNGSSPPSDESEPSPVLSLEPDQPWLVAV